MPLKENKLTETEQKLFNFMSRNYPEFDDITSSGYNGTYRLSGVYLEELTTDKFSDIYESDSDYVDGIYLSDRSDYIWIYKINSEGLMDVKVPVGETVRINQAARILEHKGILVISKVIPTIFGSIFLYENTVIFMNKEGSIREFDGRNNERLKLDEYLDYWN